MKKEGSSGVQPFGGSCSTHVAATSRGLCLVRLGPDGRRRLYRRRHIDRPFVVPRFDRHDGHVEPVVPSRVCVVLSEGAVGGFDRVLGLLLGREGRDGIGDRGLQNPELSVLSPEFLDKVSTGEKTNLQFDLMKKLLNDKIRTVRSTNVVEGHRFSEMLDASIRARQNRTITTAQAIQHLVGLAKEMNEQGCSHGAVAENILASPHARTVVLVGCHVIEELSGPTECASDDGEVVDAAATCGRGHC